MISKNLPSGQYRIQIQAVKCSPGIAEYRYEISTGPFAGFGTEKFKETGGYPLYNRFFLPKAAKALFMFLTAAGAVSSISNPDLTNTAVVDSLLKKTIGKILSVYIESSVDYLSVRRHDPALVSSISPAEIKIGTSSWSAGSADVKHAINLSNYSGLPSIFVDVHEKDSPMVDWCANHRIIPVPAYFHAGDYSAAGSDVIVDRKKDILELYADFSTPQRYQSYCTAAQKAAVMGKKLIYVIGSDDHISSVEDLKRWSFKDPYKKGISVTGESIYRNIMNYQKFFPNTSFIFVPESNICETIFNLIT